MNTGLNIGTQPVYGLMPCVRDGTPSEKRVIDKIVREVGPSSSIVDTRLKKQNTCNLTMTMKREMFLPIKLPSHKSFQGKNLTGTERFIYNLAADIYANIQQWDSFHTEGVTYLRNIIQVKHDKNYSVILQDMCDKLENVCNNLDGIITNLEQIKNQFIAITVLQETTTKLFLTWPTSKFDFHKECASSFSQMFVKHFMDFCTPLTEFEARIDAVSVVQHPGTLQYLIFIFNIYSEIAETIYQMYHKEATLKRNLLENIAHNHTETWKMFYLAAWVHQPLLSENLTLLWNSLLIETGHQ